MKRAIMARSRRARNAFVRALGGNLGDPTRWMLGATRNRILSGFATLDTGKSGLNFTGSRLKFGTLWATDELAFHFSGAQCTEGGNAPQETVLAGNATTINAAFLVYGGTSYPILFSGSASTIILSGSVGAWGFAKLPITLPADASYELLTFYSVAVGEKFYGQYRIQKHRGEKVWQGDSYASVKALADADAPIATAFDSFYNSTGNVTNSQNLCYGPDLIACKGWDGRAVVLGVNDSLFDRQELAASADERGNFGFAGRWFDQLSDGRLSLFQMGCPGAKALNELGPNSSKRYEALDELTAFNGGGTKRAFTHIFQQMGRNDNNTAAATWVSPIRALNQRLRARYPEIPIIGATIPATATSSNRWQTAAGQTLSTLWSATLAAVNDTIKAGNSGTTDNVIDLNAYRMTAEGKYRPGNERLKGSLVAVAGDGTTPFNTMVVDFLPSLGQQYTIDYGDGTGTTLTACVVIDIQGSGPWTITRDASFTTSFPAGSKFYEQPSPDGTHFNKEYNIQSVALTPASEKAKFIVVPRPELGSTL